MTDQLVALILDEGKWLTASMGLAFLSITILLYRHRHSDIPKRRLVLAAMNLFFGIMIGSMAFGHLLAVTTKLALGTLEGSISIFYIIGTVLAVPSWWLIIHTFAVFTKDNDYGRTTIMLNVWLAITLLALGVHNLPLAASAFFNVGYQQNSHPMFGWVIVSIAVIVNVGLFIGSLIFLASGQSFEQFRGID